MHARVPGWLAVLRGMTRGLPGPGRSAGSMPAPADIGGRPAASEIAPYRAILADHLHAAATRTDSALSAARMATRPATREVRAGPALIPPASP